MKKLILLSSLLLLLVGCSGINSDIHSKGGDIVNLINNSHESLLPLTNEESDKLTSFFVEYPPPPLDDTEHTDEESFIFKIEYLRLTNVIYLNSISRGDTDKANENLSKYNEILTELQDEFNINID